MAGDAAHGAPIPTVPPDPGLLTRIRPSAGRLIQFQDDFVQQLQYDLLSVMPDLPLLRGEDGWAFCERMVRALLWAAVTDQPPPTVADAMRQLGARNWLDGFPETQYVAVVHALVHAVRDLSGDDWSTSMGSSWIGFFTWVRPHLMAGAQQAAFEQAATQQRPGWQRPAAPEPRPARPASSNGEVNLESVAGLLDDEEDEDDDPVGYGQIMLSMTRNRRDHPQHPN